MRNLGGFWAFFDHRLGSKKQDIVPRLGKTKYSGLGECRAARARVEWYSYTSCLMSCLDKAGSTQRSVYGQAGPVTKLRIKKLCAL